MAPATRATAIAYDSAGVRIIESSEPLWTDTTRWIVSDGPELGIGVVDGDPAYQFNRIGEVVRTSSDRILVANGGSNEVRGYDPDGRHVRTYGGAGEGPEEFQALAGFVVGPDTVFVFDPALMRLTPFDSSGRVWETVLDTYSTPTRSGSFTFARYTSTEVHQDSLYMTDGGEYEVRVYGPDGTLDRVLRRLVDRRPVTEEFLDEYVESAFEGAPPSPEARRDFEERMATWHHGEALPWISGLVVDDPGNVWVREYQHRFELSPADSVAIGPFSGSFPS